MSYQAIKDLVGYALRTRLPLGGEQAAEGYGDGCMGGAGGNA